MGDVTPAKEQGVTKGQEAIETAPVAKPDKRLALVLRGLFIACGAALLVGFFLPWVKIGALLTVSGVGLSLAQGEMVGMVAGSSGFLLFAIPILGAVLIAGGITGHRLTSWLAVAGATIILGFGFYTVMRFFLQSTGFGMWLVVASAILSLAFGLLGIGRRTSSS